MQQDEHFIRRIRRRMLDKVRVHLAYQPLHKLKRFLREFVWTFDDAERSPPPWKPADFIFSSPSCRDSRKPFTN